jgi:hypothetical protein
MRALSSWRKEVVDCYSGDTASKHVIAFRPSRSSPKVLGASLILQIPLNL